MRRVLFRLLLLVDAVALTAAVVGVVSVLEASDRALRSQEE